LPVLPQRRIGDALAKTACLRGFCGQAFAFQQHGKTALNGAFRRRFCIVKIGFENQRNREIENKREE